MSANDDLPPVGPALPGLLRQFWIVSTCIGLCCATLAASVLSSQWQDFVRARRAVRHLAVFEAGLAAASRLSVERGPTNGLLGATPEDASRWRTRLADARTATDAALVGYRTALATSGVPLGDALALRVEEAGQGLVRLRAEIDALVAAPRERRDAASAIWTIDHMIALVLPLMLTNLQTGTTIAKQHPALADTVSVAMMSASLREYAGQLGSRLVVALLQGTGVTPETVAEMDRLKGRIDQLDQIVEARLANHVGDAEMGALRLALQRRYFQAGIGWVDAVRAAETARPGGSGVSAGALTERYVPEMAAIEAIRDRMLDRAEIAANADRRNALFGLILGASMVTVIFALLAATARVVHRDVVQPLIGTTRRINDLVAERFETAGPERSHFGEINDMIQAITVLRGVSIQRRHLEQEREGLLRAVRHLAETDHLTGLSNRRTFDILASDAATRGEGLAVILCDIDHFKAINDRHGHPVGDRVLQAVAERLRAAMRGSDTVFRYGGEEFAVLVVGNDHIAARRVADRLRESVSDTPIVADGTALAVTLSAGVACLPAGAPDTALSVLVDRADRALYRAKREGRNRTRMEEAADGPGAAPLARLPDVLIAS